MKFAALTRSSAHTVVALPRAWLLALLWWRVMRKGAEQGRLEFKRANYS